MIPGIVAAQMLGAAGVIHGPVVLAETDFGAILAGLDASHFVAVYLDGIDNFLTAVIGVAPGTVITVGAPANLAGSVGNTRVARLDASHFVVVYNDGDNANALTGIVGSVAGSTITAGTPAVLSASTTGGVVAALDGGSFAVLYADTTNANQLTGLVATVSGTAITAGSPAVVMTETNGADYICALAAGLILATYPDPDNSNFCTAVACSIAGAVITAGTPVLVSGHPAAGLLMALDATRAAIVYNDDPDDFPTAVIASLSGTAITLGTPAVLVATAISSGFGAKAALAGLDDSDFVMAYSDPGDSNHLKAIAATVAGTTVAAGSPVLIAATTDAGPVAAGLDATRYVASYSDSANSHFLTAVIGSV